MAQPEVKGGIVRFLGIAPFRRAVNRTIFLRSAGAMLKGRQLSGHRSLPEISRVKRRTPTKRTATENPRVEGGGYGPPVEVKRRKDHGRGMKVD